MLVSRFSIDGFEPKNQKLHYSPSREELFSDCEYGVYAFIQGYEEGMYLNHLPKEIKNKLYLWIGDIDDNAVIFKNGIPCNKKWYDLKKVIVKDLVNKPSEIFIPAESCKKIKNVKQIMDFQWVEYSDRTICNYELI